MFNLFWEKIKHYWIGFQSLKTSLKVVAAGSNSHPLHRSKFLHHHLFFIKNISFAQGKFVVYTQYSAKSLKLCPFTQLVTHSNSDQQWQYTHTIHLNSDQQWQYTHTIHLNSDQQWQYTHTIYLKSDHSLKQWPYSYRRRRHQRRRRQQRQRRRQRQRHQRRHRSTRRRRFCEQYI